MELFEENRQSTNSVFPGYQLAMNNPASRLGQLMWDQLQLANERIKFGGWDNLFIGTDRHTSIEI